MKTVGFEVKKKRTPPKKDAGQKGVREVMGLNEPDGERQATAYVGAVCAAVDVDAAYGASGGIGENVASVAVGAFSATLAAGTAGVSAYDLDMRRAIRRELQGSGLLYQGIG